MYRWLVCTILILVTVGCRSTNGDRLPATAVDNPDPIFGGTAKLKNQDKEKDAVVAAVPTGSGQKAPAADRIGPLTIQPKQTNTSTESSPVPGTPGTASLTNQVKEVKPAPVQETQVQPVQAQLTASNPQVVQDYRQRMATYGVAGLRTKNLGNGTWEAVGHFPTPEQPDQLRRIEAQGTSETDALQAIIEQLEKKK
ncbi:MAG TPA: hypothetical protein PLX97_05555 [Gemmatales bacterium]|nr:hypothetical protein [Gemmatales bacterium]